MVTLEARDNFWGARATMKQPAPAANDISRSLQSEINFLSDLPIIFAGAFGPVHPSRPDKGGAPRVIWVIDQAEDVL